MNTKESLLEQAEIDDDRRNRIISLYTLMFSMLTIIPLSIGQIVNKQGLGCIYFLPFWE